MRLAAVIAGLLACTVIFLANSGEVSAQSSKGTEELTSTDVLTLLDESSLADRLAKQDTQKPKDNPVEYVVNEGDTLAGIARIYDTQWERVFNKNENITDPNVLTPGITIIIPDEDEKLSNRAENLRVEEPTNEEDESNNASYVASSISRPSSSGNTYIYGYCTWYAKQRRPDLPNQMGNAISWVSSARSMGIATGSKARSGAIGQQGNHVVYVEKVNRDGSVTVSDMNYAGRGVVTTRKAPASSFLYIY